MRKLKMEYKPFTCIIIFYLTLSIRFWKEFLMLSLHKDVKELSSLIFLVYVKNCLHLLVTSLVIAVCRDNYDFCFKYCILGFASTTFSMQPQPVFVFLQSEAGSNNKRDKTKSCKHESHEVV